MPSVTVTSVTSVTVTVTLAVTVGDGNGGGERVSAASGIGVRVRGWGDLRVRLAGLLKLSAGPSGLPPAGAAAFINIPRSVESGHLTGPGYRIQCGHRRGGGGGILAVLLPSPVTLTATVSGYYYFRDRVLASCQYSW